MGVALYPENGIIHSPRIDPDEIEEVGKMPTLPRQVTVVDPNSEKVKAVITLDGDVDSVDNWELIQLLLRQNSGSSIEIIDIEIDIESGIIRLTVEGSQADIQKLIDKMRSGELPELNGLPVLEISTENLDTEKINKWDLVQAIVDRRITDHRNLNRADLRGTGVEKTRFGDNQGISESMKLDLQQRGAIFEDFPGDRSETYALR